MPAVSLKSGTAGKLKGSPNHPAFTHDPMVFFFPSRTIASTAAVAALGACLAVAGSSLSAQPPGQPNRSSVAHSPAARPAHPKQEHLAQWMDRHRNLPLERQQDELAREPGFRDLPQQTQQRMRDRLTQLNNMPPEQRQRLLERTEAMEQLTPPQRQQVRGAMQQLSGLPPDRRRLVARAFRDLREMPTADRQAALSSDRFRGQFTDQERSTLSNLLAVEPYLPAPKPADAP